MLELSYGFLLGSFIMSKEESTADHINKRIAKIIKDKRKKLGLTQNYVADKINVTAQQVQKYESGINSFKVSRLIEFGDILNIPTEQFFPVGLQLNPLNLPINYNKQFINEETSEFVHKPKNEKKKNTRCNSDEIPIEEIQDFINKFLLLDKETKLHIISLVSSLAEKET